MCTEIDIEKAFWHVELAEESKKYTGFMFRGRTYVFNRLPFGIKIARAVCMSLVRRVLGNALLEVVKVYLDDILIYCADKKKHLKIILEVLRRLYENGITINFKKCEWLQRQVTFLGHTFSDHHVHMEEETKKAVMEYRTTRSKKALQAFLGL